MHYSFPLVAISATGATRLFYDVESFLVFAHNRQNGGVGAYWRETYLNHGSERLVRVEDIGFYRGGAINNWIVRDNCGRVVDKRVFGDLPRHWVYPSFEEARRAAAQGLPIPGSGRSWRSSKKWTKNGRNGAHNQRKGIRLYEDPLINNGQFDDL